MIYHFSVAGTRNIINDENGVIRLQLQSQRRDGTLATYIQPVGAARSQGCNDLLRQQISLDKEMCFYSV